MNEVASYNWRAFFTTRLDSINPRAPLGGIEGSGWRLVYSSEPDEMFKLARSLAATKLFNRKVRRGRRDYG